MYIRQSRRSQRRDLRQKLTLYLIFGVIGLTIFGFVASFVVFAWFARDLPSPGKLSQQTTSSTVFYDRNGKVLYDMYKDKNRVPVVLADIPKDLQHATVAIEDKAFYTHNGISETGILRAILSTIFRGQLQGGSTITQQLIKNVLLDQRRVISRKIREAILAISVEKKYTKDQILEMYLNEAPYGGNLWGVGSAAKGYFGKDPKDLTLTESAILAGLPQSPSRYSPFIGGNDFWRTRAKEVLRVMREQKYITVEQEKNSLATLLKVRFTTPHLAIEAPHFTFYVRDIIEQEYGSKLLDQGIKINTTLSLDVQRIVEKIVKEEIVKLKNYDVGNGAVVVLDSKTSEILAMVGSYDFNDDKFGKFNAALGLRQPGSTMKPITYALAFEKGYTPATVVMDVKTVFPVQGQPDYIPVNYDGKFKGPLQLRFALGNSINIPAVKLLAMVGVKDFLTKASSMGLNTLAPTQENINRFGLSLTLGGGEVRLLDLTNAFSVFAKGGIYKDTQAIQSITDFNNHKVFQARTVKNQQVVTPESSFLISHILSDNNARIDEFGPNSYLNIPGKTVAVKTGTTNDKRDNWAVGYTKDVTIGVWVGNNDNSVMNPKIASGETGASPIWYRIMRSVLSMPSTSKDKYLDGIMDKSENVKALTVDSYLGGLPKDGSPTRSEYFIDGTQPKDISPYYKKLKISKSNGKLANDIEVKTGNFDEKDFIVITENDPVSIDGKNRWQDAINNWMQQQSDSKYKAPTDVSDNSSDSVIVSIKNPSSQTTVNSGSVELKVKITTLDPLKKVEMYINNNIVKTFNEDKRDIDEVITTPLSDGVYQFKVVATSTKDKQGDSTVTFGVNKPWDSVTPTP